MPNELKFLVLADAFGTIVQAALRERLAAVESCHALLLLGDLPARTYPILRDDFGFEMPGFCVLGNHDGDHWADWLPRYRFQHLHKSLASLRVSGCEVTLGGFSGSERYKREGRWQWDDQEAQQELRSLHTCDILLTHTADTHPEGKQDHRHRGLPAIGQYIQQHQPFLALHGHFHHNYRKSLGNTQVVGCFGAVLLRCTWHEGGWQVATEPLLHFD